MMGGSYIQLNILFKANTDYIYMKTIITLFCVVSLLPVNDRSHNSMKAGCIWYLKVDARILQCPPNIRAVVLGHVKFTNL
jgi:hypothetical protein